MDILNEDIVPIERLIFREKYALYQNQYNSFHQFIEEIIFKELKESPNVIHENFTEDHVYRYRFIFDDIRLKPPVFENEDRDMWPEDARRNHLTYSSKLVATVRQIQEKIDIRTNKMVTKTVGDIEKDVPIARIPIMVRSKYCRTNIDKGEENTECQFDPGCYFIVNGSEKVILSLERICENKPLVFTSKDNSYEGGRVYSVQIRSKTEDINSYPQTFTLKMKKDKSIIATTSQIPEAPLFILMRALGIETDHDIVKYIVYDETDTEMINLVSHSMEKVLLDPEKPEAENNRKVKTQNDAIEYLINKMRHTQRYSDTSLDIQNQQKRMYLNQVLSRNMLPHLGENLQKKAYYIGYMVNRMLSAILGRRKPDDRDSYVNKRIDLPGILLGQLFKQYYNKMLHDITRFFRKKNNNDETPINVIDQIKPGTIEQGLKSGLMTGTWGAAKSKKGVAQALQRLTYALSLSYLRRIITPSVDSSTNKQTSIRHVINNQYGFIDAVETPEGGNIGLIKHLSLTGHVTLMLVEQVGIIKEIVVPELIMLEDTPAENFAQFVKVFLNGEWLGMTDKPIGLTQMLKDRRRAGDIEKSVSIVFHIGEKEIHIFCDGGRIIRPLLRVENNRLLITKEIINEVTDSGQKGIQKWNQLMQKYPDIVEYVDIEEADTITVAMYCQDVIDNRQMMELTIKKPNENGDPINRYLKTYKRFTHCEFHPTMQLGSISSNIPFADHNQSPRNIYNFSQAKQSMGIYATNHRLRMDISYLLYHPQRPIVITRAAEYLQMDQLPAGENAIVAIACYSGYNQEDSIIMNRSAVDRGLYRSTSLKKYNDEIKKNPSTSQDDIFTKPDRNKVTGMKNGNYDKLNDLGFVPEETPIEKGDVIIGKISPIQPRGDTNKIYKDSSQIYKVGVPAVIDKVEHGIYNADGYEMYSVRVRSERTPRIGDKFSSRAGQKGTIGIVLTNADMPFTKDGVQPDIIINPNCIPSRMTIGQLIECLVGKVGAIRGHVSDGTPFNNTNPEEIKDILESLGYQRDGYETLYCGMTGKKMEVQIFIGPTYYYRLKHLVEDKIHSRARGPQNILTRQPPEGRSRDGGLKFGEMERDCMIAHGMAQFLKERFVETSDIYFVHVCNSCGLFASKMINKDIYVCQSCRNYTDVSKIAIPYAFKLLLQELQAISILGRIRVKKDEYEDSAFQ